MKRWRLLSRRLAFYVVTAWLAVTLNFAIPRLMPGNAVEAILSRLEGSGPVTPRALHALTLQFGVGTSTSIFHQYLGYLGDIVHGNLGISLTYFPEPVSSLIAQSLPWTLVLVGVATVIAFLLGTGLGLLVGLRRGSWLDSFVPVTTLLTAMPYFWIGLVLISIFSITFGLLPFDGGASPGLTPAFTAQFIGDAARHAILPATTIILASIGGWLIGMRNMVVGVLSEDYVVLAQAKGLPRLRIALAYVARNAVLPNVASFALSLGFVVAGSVVTEVAFSYPGIGDLLYNAVTGRDYPLMQGIFLVITFVVLLANLLADLAYVVLDPRTEEV